MLKLYLGISLIVVVLGELFSFFKNVEDAINDLPKFQEKLVKTWLI